MALQKIARRDSGYAVVCIVPDFCFVPAVVPPVPFPLYTNLGDAKQTARKVRINGKAAFVNKASAAPRTLGNQPGLRKGVLSRTVGAKAWSQQHSSSVRIHKHKIVRTGDFFHMNGKFNKRLKRQVCLPCKAALATGRPVNPVLGLKFLSDEIDFTFGGILPLNWTRSYYSDQEGTGWLGTGWSLPFSQHILHTEAGFAYVDAQGRIFPLPDLEADSEPVFYESEQIWFSRNEAGHCFIANLDGSLVLRFAPLNVSSEDPFGQQSEWWPLVAIEDADGNHQRILYHHLTGLPEYLIDGNGRIFYFSFTDVSPTSTPLARLSAVYLSDHLPTYPTRFQPTHQAPLVRYGYTPEGDLAEVYDQSGTLTRTFTYRNHIMVSHTDAAGLVSSYEYDRYDTDGKVLRNFTSEGEQWHFTYHPSHTEVKDILGRTEQYHFDDNKELIRHIKADGSETLMERDHLGRLLSQTDELGRTVRYEYSTEGQITALIRPDNSRIQFDYDDAYRLIVQTDAEGNRQSYGYDEIGHLVSHTDALKHTTRFTYTANGLLHTVTSPEGSITRYEYDRHNQPATITDCSGNPTRLQYTPTGEISSITDALGHQTRYHYDNRRRPVRTDHPDGSSESFQYDEAGRLTVHTDALGQRTCYQYAPDGLPLRRTNALGHTFEYSYDPARRLIGLTNENGARYHFVYDPLDRLIAESAFDGKLSTYSYNAAGELLLHRDYGIRPDLSDKLNIPADNEVLRQTEYRYGANGLPERISVHSGGSVQEKAYAYDGDGRLVRAAENHHISSFDYDGNGRLSAQYSRSTETADPSLPPTPWDDAQYDPLYFGQTQNQTRYYTPAGYLSQLQLPDQRRLGWLYYGNGHLHHINLDGDTVSDIERDALHRETQRSQGSLHSSYSRDPIGRLQKRHTAAAERTVLSGSYVYDRNGNLIESRHPDSGITHFGYDPLGRIQSATASRIGLAQTFHYDPAHNLIDTPNTDPVHDNRISQYQNNRYRYDTFGNTLYRELADGTQHTYTYDLFDRMVSVRIDHPDNRQPQIWHYRYDALDRRIAKWQETETQEQTDKVEFIWDGSRLLQEVHPDRTHTYIYTEADSYEPLAQITNYTDPDKTQQIHYFHCDQIGIPREMSDEAGNIVWRGQYDAWGKLLHEEKADGIHQPFRLQNQYYDQETGLHYNFFRYYDPTVGRFTRQDPIGLAGGENFYEFASNINIWIDPLGLAKICTRPLSGLSFLPNPDINPTKRYLPDLGVFHEHIFFKDGTNIGFTTTGLFSESDKKVIASYKCSEQEYDDKLLKQAVQDVKNRNTFVQKNPSNRFEGGMYVPKYGNRTYNVILHNCQDFVSEVIGRYDEISKFKK